MTAIRINIGGIELAGRIEHSDLAELVIRQLPLDSWGETWGREVYFPIPLKVGNTAPVLEVKPGDIAYWPDGPDLCLFFGPTPKSTGDTPVAASPVTVIGSFQFAPDDFDRIARGRRGIRVRIEKQPAAD